MLVLSVSSQNQRVNFKLGLSSMNAITPYEFNGETMYYKETKKHPQIQLNYKFNQIIDIGIFIGYSKLHHRVDLIYNEEKGYYALESIDGKRKFINVSPGTHKYDSHAFFYGLKSDIHILPILFKKSPKRIDLYVSPFIGTVSERYQDIDNLKIVKPLFLSYSAGIGSAYYLTKHLGIYGEYHIGNFYNQSLSRWQGGISVNF